jgi:hypothetical protein
MIVENAARDARSMWTLFEPIHAITYFAAESRAAFEALGLRGFWRGYFAGRAAPLGAVGPAPVVAAFFGFAPSTVARALPHVWELADPERVLAARLDGAIAGLRRLAADQLTEAAIDEAAALAVTALEELDCAGRVLGAANAALPVPADPLGRLWWAATVLREHRGDGHVAALVAAGLTGCDVLCWRASVDIPRPILQPNRGWTDEQWEASMARLVDRGWLNDEGRPTTTGIDEFQHIERLTDRAAAQPWRRLGEAATSRLRELLTPVALTCFAEMPAQTPIGLPHPAVAA